MALFDKVKTQATQLAQKAQEAGKAGQGKLEDAQARRRADGLLRDLGAALYAQRSGRDTTEGDERIERLIAELSALEVENASSLDVSARSADEVDGGGAGGDSGVLPGGGFTLDP